MVQVSPKLKIPGRIPIKFDSNSRLESSLNFHLKTPFESEEDHMEKVVPLFKSFNYLFYLKFFKHEKFIS
jgi:hypothetical protein